MKRDPSPSVPGQLTGSSPSARRGGGRISGGDVLAGLQAVHETTGAPATHVQAAAGAEQAIDLAQWQVAEELERRRPACLDADSKGESMRCLLLCLTHRLPLPAWLSIDIIRRAEQVTGAHVKTWDEAFGTPWPKRTRLAVVRKRRRLKVRVHAAVWALVSADLSLSINRILFDLVGELPNVSLPASTVEHLYYEALHDGQLSVATWRDAQRRSCVLP